MNTRALAAALVVLTLGLTACDKDSGPIDKIQDGLNIRDNEEFKDAAEDAADAAREAAEGMKKKAKELKEAVSE